MRYQPITRGFASEVRVILPALFKVEANPCNVALLGSTPKVSEKSLDRIPSQHILLEKKVVMTDE